MYGNTTLGETDSAADDYHDGVGSRSDRGRAVQGAVDQYDLPMAHEDRTAGQKAVAYRNGQAVYVADMFEREPGPGLPNGYNGQDYSRSPSQAADEHRRVYGSQVPTSNEDNLIPGKINMKSRSEEFGRTGR
jgi:hypothetical protein